jgi:hypothetical protein
MELKEFLITFQDDLAPRLDCYEQALYLFIFRHSRLLGQEEVVIGFKSARSRMACGIGEKGKPMSENAAYEKLRSMETKGCIKIVDTTRTGRRLKLFLPSEIPGIAISQKAEAIKLRLEEIDFFLPENRAAILKRDGNICFYCRRKLDAHNYVIEHVVSRPEGDNSYKNLVSACRACNNHKKGGAGSSEEFLRSLYRDGLLSEKEIKERINALENLRNGLLIPCID